MTRISRSSFCVLKACTSTFTSAFTASILRFSEYCASEKTSHDLVKRSLVTYGQTPSYIQMRRYGDSLEYKVALLTGRYHEILHEAWIFLKDHRTDDRQKLNNLGVAFARGEYSEVAIDTIAWITRLIDASCSHRLLTINQALSRYHKLGNQDFQLGSVDARLLARVGVEAFDDIKLPDNINCGVFMYYAPFYIDSLDQALHQASSYIIDEIASFSET